MEKVKLLISNLRQIKFPILIPISIFILVGSLNWFFKREPNLLEAIKRSAAEFKVPEEVLLATAYSESRGHLLISDNGKGRYWIRLMPWRPSRRPHEVAEQLGVSVEKMMNDPVLALRGAAALIARQHLVGDESLESWRVALEKWNGSATAEINRIYADDVFSFIYNGIESVDGSGAAFRILHKEKRELASLPSHPRPKDVPGFSEARAYFPGSDLAHRPLEKINRPIKYIVIHVTENSFPTILDYFNRPTTKVGAHYLIRASDGNIVQTADERRVVFHAACFNEESIGIEHEGYVAAGRFWFSEAMYQSSAKLVRDIAKRYDIPLDRKHIVGHRDTPGGCSEHTDPGKDWDWERFMKYLNET